MALYAQNIDCKITKNNYIIMNKFFLYLFTLVLLISCSSSKSVTTIAKGNDISMYKYVVYGSEDEGDAELADI